MILKCELTEDAPTLLQVMVDPDAPSPDDRKWGEYLHWIVTNIPGSFSATCQSELARCVCWSLQGFQNWNVEGREVRRCPCLIERLLPLRVPEFCRESNEVVSYTGPAPPEGRHRYIFVLYKQVCIIATSIVTHLLQSSESHV